MAESLTPPELFPKLESFVGTARTVPVFDDDLRDVVMHDNDAVSDVDSVEDLYQSYPPSRGDPATPSEQVLLSQDNAPNIPPRNPDLSRDIAGEVKGMYRVLDLIYEQGSGGLVDKIIIAQESVEDLVNRLSPRAYTSLTQIDFKSLDGVLVSPIGIYGSKSELVKFLVSLDAVDQRLAAKLLSPTDPSLGRDQALRSGLYVLMTDAASLESKQQVYIMYWPEDTTWDDSAVSTIRRNRTTFMRYLTKMSDQLVALVSPDHEAKIVWRAEEEQDDDMDADEDSDRLVMFEVKKRTGKEESVSVRPGFKIFCPELSKHMLDHGLDQDVLRPRLLLGDNVQGFLIPRFVPRTAKKTYYNKKTVTRVALQDLLRAECLLLSDNLDDASLTILFDCGLRARFPSIAEQYRLQKEEIIKRNQETLSTALAATTTRLDEDANKLEQTLRFAFVDDACKGYPALDRSRLHVRFSDMEDRRSDLATLMQMLPQVKQELHQRFDELRLNAIGNSEFRRLKNRIIAARLALRRSPNLDAKRRESLVDGILAYGIDCLKDQNQQSNWTLSMLSFWKAATGQSIKGDNDILSDVRQLIKHTSDGDFLESLGAIDAPELETAVAEVIDLVHRGCANAIELALKKAIPVIRRIQESEIARHNEQEARSIRDASLANLRAQTLRLIREACPADGRRYMRVESLDEVAPRSRIRLREPECRLAGALTEMQDPMLEFTLYPVELSEEHRHNLRLDSTFVPKPTIDTRRCTRFRLKPSDVIVLAQLLGRDKILLVVRDGSTGQTYINVDRVNFIFSRRPMRSLHPERTGSDYLVAFDESRRLLSICSPKKLELHVFAFDEEFSSLQGYCSSILLTPWFTSGAAISFIRFVPGTEDILLIDDAARARVFSLVSQQCRPATLQLPCLPEMVHCTPDGACFIASYRAPGTPTPGCSNLIAYHWGTFGSSPGISLEDANISLSGAVITTFVNRTSTHIVYFDYQMATIQSLALDITQRTTEFNFTQKSSSLTRTGTTTVHNSLIDCHAAVWTRFPVLPAVRRGTFTENSRRCSKSLTFVINGDHRACGRYFSSMIQDFAKRTRKPMGNELEDIEIIATAPKTFFATSRDWAAISAFRAGEWFADLFCLIPIHVAVCRENRFIPLANGVLDPELERSLLGADVSQIVDSLSFGWYESIFQSYYVNKPVKVVSSMGEQSVGKSFALNHLVDTSFAGSAMRTIEGVWMSVTPTADFLIVALDFEGVHSIERSAQEDTFLVLFNTALSNLVLFRNNFALGRDITNLFQSFQSSSSVLDPKSNSSLFKGTLAIIIKDVVDSDKDEVTKEFALKFQTIVEEEKDANFITRMHDGQLVIIPWPVITSPAFYKLYPTLKRHLDKQETAHKSAGEFLLTMKTLMAKLKANDWGSMSQTLASHRAKTIATALLIALQTGYSEIDPERVPLKNLDSGETIDLPDSESVFYLQALGYDSEYRSREASLSRLVKTWATLHTRQTIPDAEFIDKLSAFLNRLVDMRMIRVHNWLDSNFSRFEGSQASIEEVYRSFNNASIDIKASVQLCKVQCLMCNLLCLQSRLHEGPHDCLTGHNCVHTCSFAEHPDQVDTTNPKMCTMRAGHNGRHLCSVNAHLCGEACVYSGKLACLDECVKMVGHTDEHVCSAQVHMCGEPCDLKGIKIPTGKKFACSGLCHVPNREPHSVHSCDARLCPVACELCNRLCQETHLHGLDKDAIHLCGEEHSCNALCMGPGVCEISTQPQSIEATFTGRNETFQYTKYSQVASQKRCAIVIKAGQKSHEGHHLHSTKDQPFHFCNATCESCGYYCTLPHGHAQQEHETSHGSMSKTRWAVQGTDDVMLDVSGRKFSANDEGAPMMCNMVCLSMGRHVHIDFCRSDADGGSLNCENADVEHITTAMLPNPSRAKDAITHSLFWRRAGFKDPYPRDDQVNFAKCDALCPGPEHTTGDGVTAQPSYCILPMFHSPAASNNAAARLVGYISNDGHAFTCSNPAVMQQAFHVIFVIDRSSSMGGTDRVPLSNAPSTALIARAANNRLGAVYSALYAFWSARHAAATAASSRNSVVARRDAYSVVFFDRNISHGPINDLRSTPDQLLAAVLSYRARSGTNFTKALRSAQEVMEQNWSNEKKPVVIFLSDGEAVVSDGVVRDLCHAAIRLGKPLSFHSVSFGPSANSWYLRRMADIALEAQNNAPADLQDVLGRPSVPSSYSVALDTVALAETFLGLADSLRKPRGSLLR